MKPMTRIETDGEPPVVLFHDQCMDGLVAAWVAWRHYHGQGQYIPVRYGAPPPVACASRNVLIVDFCYPPDVTEQLANGAKQVIILDHHKTAIERFEAGWRTRSDVVAIFDTTRSGAELTEWFFTEQQKDWLVSYVGDRDLWKFQLPHSREVNAYLAATVLGLETHDAFCQLEEIRRTPLQKILERGIGAQRQVEAFVLQVGEEVRRIPRFAGYEDIPLVNLAKPMTSDVLNALAKTSLFAMGWRVEKSNRIIFSLRSTDPAGVDVQDIAKAHGGGGHKHAAGFTVPPTKAWLELVFGDLPAEE